MRRGVVSSEQFTGWAFVTPAAVIIGLFGAAPIVWSAVMSFQENNLLSPSTPFVGTANYRQLAHDPVVAQAIQHTLVYTVLFVPGTMAVGLFLAVAMNRKIRFISVYRTAAYATMAVSTISEAIVFIWLFDPSYGVINYFLSWFGVPPQQFINSPSQALYVIVIMTIWGWTGFAVVIYLAALQGVPQHLTEAAAIDGAGPWQAFRRVTLPLLSPATLFLAAFTSALQVYLQAVHRKTAWLSRDFPSTCPHAEQRWLVWCGLIFSTLPGALFSRRPTSRPHPDRMMLRFSPLLARTFRPG